MPVPHRASVLPHLLLGLAFLLLYTLTLAPGLLPADSGEYQLTGALLGVAHPPGFALYTLASWLISRAPGVAPAAAINWLSALLAAGALALLSRGSARLWGPGQGATLAGLAGAAVVGISTTFWAQAVTANIRMPAAFATAWAFERLVAYRAQVQAQVRPRPANPKALDRALAWLALALGVGVSHHASLVFMAAVLGGYALWLRPAALRRPWPLLAGALPFLAWLYFPLRAGAFGAPAGIDTLPGFVEHILALGFRGDLFFFASPAALPERLRLFANILYFEFVGPALLLMTIGAVAGLRLARTAAAALLLAVGVHVFVAMTYRAPQTVEYLLPAFVLMGAWAAAGLAALARLGRAPGVPRQRRLVLRLAASLLATYALGLQWQATAVSYQQLAHDEGTRAYAEAVLGQAPPGAVVLANWHWATPLWYLQRAEGQRPDVAVRYVFPQGESLARNWADEISAALPERPVVVTSYYAAEYAALPYHFVPLGPAWAVLAEPPASPPPDLAGAVSSHALNFLGYRLEASSEQGVSLHAAWQRTNSTPETLGFFVHLIGPNGALHSQHDVTYPGESYAPGEVLLDRYTLPLAPHAPAGAYQLVAGAYRPAAPGERLLEVPLQTFTLEQPPSAVETPPEAVPFGGALWLAEAHLEPTGPFRPGQAVTVRLDFIAARPLTADYAVSVGLIGPDFRWQVRDDGTPAGGAIPTLKWIAGSRVTDTRTLTIPPDAAPGPVTVTLVIYDSFTQQPLPVMGEAVTMNGALVLGEVEVIGN